MMDERREQESQDLAPAGDGKRKRQPTPLQSVIFIAMGAFLTSMIPLAGTVLMAYGVRGMSDTQGRRGFGIAALMVAALVAVTGVSSIELMVAMIPPALAVLGIVWCMRDRRANPTAVIITIAALGCVALALDAAQAASTGTSISKVIIDYIFEVVRESAGNDAQTELVLEQVEPVLALFWPLAYMLSGAIDAFAAGVGSHLMSVRTSGDARVPNIARFDAPLWCVGVLALAILGTGASFLDIPAAEIIRTVCVTVLMSIRFVFAAQGLGVASAVLSRSRLGCIALVPAIIVLFWLETMFMIVSIVGLIDVWVDFRHLRREPGNGGANS